MKVLVVGGGGREHALVWKIAQSPQVSEILAAPGNAGVERLARRVPVAADDIDGIIRLAVEEECDLTVVGPELPLTLGLADRLAERGRAVFGPSQAAARLEGSKWFAKQVMYHAGVPTARAWPVGDRDDALFRVREVGYPAVIKADGLAAGKGVVIVNDEEEAERTVDEVVVRGRFGEAGSLVLVEEYLEGEEASILAFVDGDRVALLTPSQDHKRAYDGDEGPNTGGMGAYAPTPVVTDAVLEEVRARVIEATLDTLQELDGTVYRGVLYVGLMLTSTGPRVLEFNCRFGDPEAQVTLPLLETDIVPIMEATARGELDPSMVRTSDGSAACVVMASGGYPGSYEKGKSITGLREAAEIPGVAVFHAGTETLDGDIVTSGGRVLGVTGTGADLTTATERAYAGVRTICFEGARYRRDIGRGALRRSVAS